LVIDDDDDDDEAYPQIQMYRGRTVEVRNMMRVMRMMMMNRVLRSCTNWRRMWGKEGSLAQDSTVVSEVAMRIVGDDTAVPAIHLPPIRHFHPPPIVIST